MDKNTIYDCSIITLPKISNQPWNLTLIQNGLYLPFFVKRIFYTYDIPGGESRGAHSHKFCHQFIISVSGAFEILLDDGINKRTILLNRPYNGLYVPPGIWASQQGFSAGSICLVMASHEYDEDDYIRDYNHYKIWLNS